MQKIDRFTHAAKVVALVLPPVAMSLLGLAALSRRKAGRSVVAAKRPASQPGTGQRQPNNGRS